MNWNFRALELHGRSMWDHSKIKQAFGFIANHNLNALVLHESDLTNQIVFPRSLFDPYSFWSAAPVRRGFNAIDNDRAYMRYLLSLAEKRGVQIWLELKELTFPDEVLERYPHLLKNGTVCPSEPTWFEFIERKFSELCEDFPQIAGIITSPGSPEGRASLAQRKCRCPLCEKNDLTEWYRSIIESMHRPLSKAGMKLAVRDFSYKKSEEEAMISAVEKAPSDVIFCIKVTPYDFYPTYPHNPALGMLDRVQWIEYETFGQFYGWGVFPSYMQEDLEYRLEYSEAKGASGILLRAEWERINDWWCLENLNRANLIAGAGLVSGKTPDPSEVFEQTFAELGFDPSRDELDTLTEVLTKTWHVMKKGIYMKDFVFHDSSRFPLTIRKAWWRMITHQSLTDWISGKDDLEQLDYKKIGALIEEKDQALTEIRALRELVDRQFGSGVSDLGDYMRDRFGLYELYIEGFRLLAEVCLWYRPAEQQRSGLEGGGRKAAATSLRALGNYRKRLESVLSSQPYRHQVLMLLDTQRIDNVLEEAGRS